MFLALSFREYFILCLLMTTTTSAQSSEQEGKGVKGEAEKSEDVKGEAEKSEDVKGEAEKSEDVKGEAEKSEDVKGEAEKSEDEKPKEIDEWDTIEPEYDVPTYDIPKGPQTLAFDGSDLNNEDTHSVHMPLELKCDACRAIAYVIKEKLKGYQKRYKTKEHLLSEWDVVDLVDQVCRNKDKKFDDYGLKEIRGKRRLAGEGLETKDVPGVQAGGGRWPFRLQTLCDEFVEEVGEYVIYEHYLQRKSLENLICRNKKTELGPICPKKKKKKKKKKDAEESKTESQEPSGAESVQTATGSGPDNPENELGQDQEKVKEFNDTETQLPQKDEVKKSKEAEMTPDKELKKGKDTSGRSQDKTRTVKEEL